MSQPVKLSDALVLDARLAGEVTARSIASQVEFWARLGRSIEPLLQGAQVMALCRDAVTRPLSQCLEDVDTPAGRRRLSEHFAAGPFPRYEAHPDRRGLLIRTEADGRRTVGRFVRREFQPVRGGSKKR